MAVLPLTDPRVLALVCDVCHRGLGGITAHLTGWPIIWRIAVQRGWSGPDDPGGPHRCPACAHAPSQSPVSSPRSRLLAHLSALGTVATVRLTGDLDNSIVEDLQAVLAHATVEHTHVVVDLQGVPLIDSTALGVLVRTHQRLKPLGGKVCLAAPSRFVRVVLHTMHLEAVFPTFESTGAALDRLSRRTT